MPGRPRQPLRLRLEQDLGEACILICGCVMQVHACFLFWGGEEMPGQVISAVLGDILSLYHLKLAFDGRIPVILNGVISSPWQPLRY